MRYFKIAIFVASLLLAIFFINQSRYLRSLGYETIPEPYVADEFNYVWQALSLEKHGLPIAWSIFNGVYSDSKFASQMGDLQGFQAYVEKKPINIVDFKKDSKPLTIVKEVDWGKGVEHMTFVMPFFDHSPLGGMIYRLGIKNNVSGFDEVRPVDFRKPALFVAIITVILLFVFVFQITNKPWIAAIACGIYSTVPTYTFATRGAYLENISPPFILGHLILLLISIDLLKLKSISVNFTYLTLFVSGLLGGLGGLSKETSVGFLIATLIIVIVKKIPFKFILTFVLGMALPIVIYLGWGLWLQGKVFTAVILANAIRGDFGSLKFLTTLESLRFRGFPIDGWWVWGIISMFFVGFVTNIKNNKYIYLTLPTLCTFLVVIFTANSNYPWYWLSLIPFMAGASAIVIGKLFESPSFLLITTFFLIPFSSSFYWGYSVFHSNSLQNLNVYRGSFVILIAAYLTHKYSALFVKRFKYSRYIWPVVLALILFAVFKWNHQSIQYLVVNWGKLPIPSIPEI